MSTSSLHSSPSSSSIPIISSSIPSADGAQSIDQAIPNAPKPSAAVPSSSSSSSSPSPSSSPSSSGFFSFIRSSFSRNPQSSHLKRLLSSSRLHFLSPTFSVYVSSPRTIGALHSYLSLAHQGSYMIFDVQALSSIEGGAEGAEGERREEGGTAAKGGSVVGLFASSRMEFDDFPSLSLEEIVRLGLSCAHWTRAEKGKNICVLAVRTEEAALLLSAAILFIIQTNSGSLSASRSFPSLARAVECYGVASKALSNRFLASVRRMAPSHRHLLSDLATVIQPLFRAGAGTFPFTVNPSAGPLSPSLAASSTSSASSSTSSCPPSSPFSPLSSPPPHLSSLPLTPTLYLTHIIIHRLPSLDVRGTRLSLLLLQSSAFLYSSMQQGTLMWIPTSQERELTVEVPVGKEMRGGAQLKVYHLAEGREERARRLLAQVNVHTGAAVKIAREKEKEEKGGKKGNKEKEGKQMEPSDDEEEAVDRYRLFIPSNEIDLCRDIDIGFDDHFSIELLFERGKEGEREKEEGRGTERSGISSTRKSKKGRGSTSEREKERDMSPCVRWYMEDRQGRERPSDLSGSAAVSSLFLSTANDSDDEEEEEGEEGEGEGEGGKGREEKSQEQADYEYAKLLQAQLYAEEREQRRRASMSSSSSSSSLNSQRSLSPLTPPNIPSVTSVPSSSSSLSPPSIVENDEEFARSLQAEFDQEARVSSSPSLVPSASPLVPESNELLLGEFLQLTSGQGASSSSASAASSHLPSPSVRVSSSSHSSRQMHVRAPNYFSSSSRSSFSSSSVSASLLDAFPSFVLSSDSKYVREKEECLVCLGRFKPSDCVRVLPCLHCYHTHCIDQWILSGHANCPVDRVSITQ